MSCGIDTLPVMVLSLVSTRSSLRIRDRRSLSTRLVSLSIGSAILPLARSRPCMVAHWSGRREKLVSKLHALRRRSAMRP